MMIAENINHKRKSINQSLRLKIFNRDGGMCQICGAKTRFNNSLSDSPFSNLPVSGSVDHIIPISKGGTNEEINLRWSCRSCNCSRGNRS
jgi:5-methylcytosine-specific restriction endonuclease McrA